MAAKFENDKRGNLHRLYPEDLTWKIPEGQSHHDPRSFKPWDDELQNLMIGIICEGVLQAIKIIKDKKTKKIIVVMGRRRTRATLRANEVLKEMAQHYGDFDDPALLSEEFGIPAWAVKRHIINGFSPIRVPCILSSERDLTRLSVQRIMENTHREDLDPVTVAKEMQAIYTINEDPEEVARAFNVSVEIVKRRLNLLDCSDDVQKAVSHGEVSQAQALAIKDKPEDEQNKILEQLKSGAKPKPRNKGPVRATKQRLYERLDPTSRDALILGWALGYNDLPEDLQEPTKKRGPKKKADEPSPDEVAEQGKPSPDEAQEPDDPTLPPDDVDDVDDTDVDFVPDSVDVLPPDEDELDAYIAERAARNAGESDGVKVPTSVLVPFHAMNDALGEPPLAVHSVLNLPKTTSTTKPPW